MNLILSPNAEVLDGVALVLLRDQVAAIERVLSRVPMLQLRFERKGSFVRLLFAWQVGGFEKTCYVNGDTPMHALSEMCQVLEAEFPS